MCEINLTDYLDMMTGRKMTGKKTFEDKLKSVLRYPEMIEAIADVLDYGVEKGYPDENWLLPDGKTMSRKANFDSMSHHNALYFSNAGLDESGLDHRAHLGTRALMGLTRTKRGIVHPDDQIKVTLNKVLQTVQEFNLGFDNDEEN